MSWNKGIYHSKKELNNHANQCNPNNKIYKKAQNNRSNQMNPNNARYYLARGKKVSNIDIKIKSKSILIQYC